MQRASSGLIVSEATSISEQGLGWVNSPGIYTGAQESGRRKLTGVLYAKGTPFLMQL